MPPVTDSAKPLVLVTGGTGAIGPALVERLLQEGLPVRVFTRQLADRKPSLPGVEWRQGDLTDPRALESATAGVDVVFHLAAKLHVHQPGPGRQAEYQSVNVEGTRRLVQAAQISGVRRLVFFSTICVYGPSRSGEILDESSRLHPDSRYAETKIQGEEICLQARQGDSQAPLAVVLRLAAVYGPRLKGNYARLVKALKRGWFVPVGAGDNRRTLIFDQDVASAALLAANHPGAAGNIYNVTDGAVHRFKEIVAAMATALGRNPPRIHLPIGGARWLARCAETGFRLAGRCAPVTPATLAKMTEDVAVSGRKMERELGFQPAFDLRRGWQATVLQMDLQTEIEL